MHTNTITIHDCGGAIIDGTAHIYSGVSVDYRYCQDCGAFVYADDDRADDMPNGTDREANRAAWDGGDTRSPDRVERKELWT